MDELSKIKILIADNLYEQAKLAKNKSMYDRILEELNA